MSADWQFNAEISRKTAESTPTPRPWQTQLAVRLCAVVRASLARWQSKAEIAPAAAATIIYRLSLYVLQLCP